jgi:aminopeptidase N
MEDSMRRSFLLVLALLMMACTAGPAQPIGPAPTPTAVLAARPKIDQASYRAAMKPEFAAEIDRFAEATQYQIDLNIASDLSSYSATQQIRYTNTETELLKEIYFSLFANLPSYGGQLTVQSVKLNGQTVTPQFEQDNALMKIALPKPLSPGEAIDWELTYSAQVPVKDVERGYNQFGLHDGILTLPNFYPQIPAYDDEGWNVARGPGYGDAVFSDTALYQVNITAPDDQVIVTSGVCETPAASAGRQVQRCVSGPMRDFMIAMSPDFVVQSDVANGVTINSYARQADEKGGRQALRAATDAVRSYDRRFGAYPFNELDVVATPTTAGGIEYPGLGVIADRFCKDGGPVLDVVVAHEVAHQWWYSLVGNDQIDEPWIDEALTQFSAALYFRDRYGEGGMDSLMQYWESNYAEVKGKPGDRRADLPVSAYSGDQYGVIVYNKAALFFNALYEALGDEKFDQLLQDYFKQHRYGVAYPQDFLKVAEGYVGKAKLDELLSEWIETP